MDTQLVFWSVLSEKYIPRERSEIGKLRRGSIKKEIGNDFEAFSCFWRG